MKKSLLEERKILIVMEEKTVSAKVEAAVGEHLNHCSFTHAASGSEAMSKIENDPPHIVIVDERLPKTNTSELIEWLLQKRKTPSMAVIWLVPIPDEGLLVDEVVTGQLQFVQSFSAKGSLSMALSRAMNYLSSNENSNEFSLKFLSPGDKLIVQGEVGRAVYLVKRGELQARFNRNGEEVFLGKIQAGEFVGEMAYINGEARSADVIADSDCELIEFPADKLDHMLFKKPSWSKALIMTLSKRLKRTNEALKGSN